MARRAGIGRPSRIVAKEGRIRGRRVALVDPGIGAPSAVLTLEETRLRGYRDFLFLGACGGLALDLRIGDVVLPEAAISEEGTSRLYTRSGPTFYSDAALLNLLKSTAEGAGLKTLRGLVWTTDAPYRETPAKIRRFRRLGATAVDMETSALFAVARLRRARVAGLLVVSDLLHSKWKIGWSQKRYEKAEREARDVLVEAAMTLADDARGARKGEQIA